MLPISLFCHCDFFSPLLLRIVKDKESMEEDHQKTLELFFAYGYECCVFKHNICGDQPEVSSFAVTVAEVLHGEAAEEPERSAPTRDLNGTS